MEGAHRPYIASLISSALTSGDGVAVYGDGLEVKLFLASEEATEGD